MKKKTYKVDLLPEDFVDCAFISNEDCALSRAMRRYFSKEFCTSGVTVADICSNGPYRGIHEREFIIINMFTEEDYEFVKEQYKDPNHDTIYFVELKEY